MRGHSNVRHQSAQMDAGPVAVCGTAHRPDSVDGLQDDRNPAQVHR